MYRRLVLLLVMLCMGWQSLASAGMQALLSEGQEKVHALLHFGGAAHHHGHAHHHDDASDGFHLDDSPASMQHVMQDASLFPPGLLMHVMLVSDLRLRPPPPAGAVCDTPPPPYLSGLERPPKRIA